MILVLSASAACAEPPPLPDLTGAEPQVKSAIERAWKETTRNPSSPDAWGRYAMFLDAHGHTDQARSAYTKAHALNPADFRWLYFHAIILQNIDPAAALVRYQQAIAIDPDYAPAIIRYAQTLRRLGRDADALMQFRKAAKRDPNHTQAHLGIGQLLLKNGDLPAARKALDRAIQCDPKNKAALSSLARLHRRLNNPDESRRFADAARTQAGTTFLADPRHFEVERCNVRIDSFMTRSEAYRNAGRLDDALTEINRMIQRAPDSAQAYTQAAKIHGQRRDFNAAAIAAMDAIQHNDRAPQAHALLAAAAYQLGQFDRASAAASTAITIDPNDAKSHFLLGQIALRRKDHATVAIHLRRCIDLDPQNASAKLLLARSLASTGHHADAEKIFTDLTENQTDAGASNTGASKASAEVWLRLALTQIAQSTKDHPRHADAIAPLEHALRLSPNLTPALQAIARCYARTNRPNQAVQTLREALARNPKADSLALELAWILATNPSDSVRNGPEAVRWANIAIQIAGPSPARLDTMAAAYAESGQYDRATNTMQQAINMLKQSKRTNPETEQAYQDRLALYKQNTPYRDR